MKYKEVLTLTFQAEIEGSTLITRVFRLMNTAYWFVLDGENHLAQGAINRPDVDVLEEAKNSAENYCAALLQNEYGVAG